MEGDIDGFLKEQNIVGIYNIDTRKLTRIIREVGVMNGVITTEDVYAKKEELLEQVRNYTIQNAILSVTGDEPRTYREGTPKYKVALYDFGYKRNIRNELVKRGCEVVVLPAATSAEELKAMHVDGIMLSNGPGDPSENQAIIDNVGEIAKLGIPIFGICLGHQLLALSQGCRTEKLKYGHRGANQPGYRHDRSRTYVTSQNPRLAVVGESLDPEVGTVSHINANDKPVREFVITRSMPLRCSSIRKHTADRWIPHICLTNSLL